MTIPAPIKLSLSSQLVVVYVGLMSFAAIVGIVITNILESNHINKTTDILYERLEDNELITLKSRLIQILSTTTDSFNQYITNVQFTATYAKNSFTGVYDINRTYPTYYVLDPNPADTVDGLNEDVSFWYQHPYFDGSSSISPFLNNATLLDNSLGSMFKSTNLYAAIYMGFEDGLLYSYPYIDVSERYSVMNYTCVIGNAPKTGYDPRCRSWYQLAAADQSSIQFTEPYVDSLTGWVMITLSQAVVVNNEFVGVVAADLSMNHLSDFVLAATVLETGYSYMCTSQSVLVVHPDVDISDGNVYYINDQEFTDDDEKAAFATLLEDYIFCGTVGIKKFIKNGSPWYVTYGKVNNTDYYLLIVVPESEVLDPAVSIQKYGDQSMSFVTVLVICVSIVCVAAGAYAAIRLASKVAGPIEAFNKVLRDIAANQFNEYNAAKEAENDFKEINHLQSKIHNLFLAVKFSSSAYHEGNDYDEALAYLTEVEDMFDMIKQKRALGDIYHNRGNILRRAGVSSGDYSKALLSFQMAVENMRVYVKKAEDDVAGEHVNDHVIEEKKANLHIFRISLASRLMNYGDCLKDARMLQESLATIEEAYLLYEGEKDIPGMLKCMGIKGLIYTELNEELAAHDILLRCKEIAYEGYEKEQNEVTVVNVQRAHLNLALHHYKLVRNTEIKENSHSARREGLEGHDELRKYLELTLHHLYTCLTLSNRIDRVVQSSCLVTLEEVYTKYYGEQGEKAVAKLYDMYPILLKLGSKINIEFVIDGSGTMFGERIEACQRILLDIVEAEMKNGDTIGVTLFEKGCVRLLHTSTNSNSNSNLNIIPLGCKISPKNREKILEEISLLSSKVTQRGVNNRHFYSTLLEIGKQIVASRECQQKWVIALTDGADTEKKTSLTDVKSFYVENGIKLIIIVVDIEDTMTKLQIQTLASEAKLFIDCKGGGENIANALEHGLKLVKNANISVEDLS